MFCKDLPPPSSLLSHGVWDGGARSNGPTESGCPLGWAFRVLFPRLPPSVLSVRQVGRLVTHFAGNRKSNSEGGNDKEAGWERQQESFLTHRANRLWACYPHCTEGKPEARRRCLTQRQDRAGASLGGMYETGEECQEG